MLNQITWHQYLTTVIVLTVIYYMWVLIRYYRPELDSLTNRLTGKTTDGQIPEAIQYQHPAAEAAPVEEYDAHYDDDAPITQDGTTHEISEKLKEVINAAHRKPFAPALLIPQLQRIIKEHPEFADSPYRTEINQLIVRECENTGTALLHEDEVDQWWSD